jgi:hypothetical protein
MDHHELRRQLREARETVLAHLRERPDDPRALLLADVLGEIDHDRELAEQRMRFRALRRDDWLDEARRGGIDRVLFRIADGLRGSRSGHDAIAVLERRAIEISEARPEGTPAGWIDASFLPEALANDRRVRVRYHEGHLAHVRVAIDVDRHGELDLARHRGESTLVEPYGGHGTRICERFVCGRVTTTFYTPWHDGVETTADVPWSRWVVDRLADLARLVEFEAHSLVSHRCSRA